MFTAVFVTTGVLFAQAKRIEKIEPSELLPVETVLNNHRLYTAMACMGWQLEYLRQLVVQHGQPISTEGPDPTRGPEEVIANIDTWLSKEPQDTTPKCERMELRYVAQYHDSLARFLRVLDREFLCPENCLPVRFAQRDGGVTLVVLGVSSENNYNILRTTARSRAAKEIQSTVLSLLGRFKRFFSGGDIKYFAVQVIYGSENFSDENHISQKAEAVTLVVSAVKYLEFAAYKITEEQLIRASDIYLSDRDDLGGIKKVEITLE
jgi:hypothetical protein